MEVSIHVGQVMIEVPIKRHRIIHETKFPVGCHFMYNKYEWKQVFDTPQSYNFVNAFNESVPHMVEFTNNIAQVCGFRLKDIALTIYTDNPYIVRLMNGEECPNIEHLEHYKKAMRAFSQINTYTVKYISFNENQTIYEHLEREKREKIMNTI